MGTLFSALDIGRSGMQAAQAQLDVTANNIANVNRPGFSRQRAVLVSRSPNITPEGAFGRGVAVAEIERVRDEFLDTVYRQQVPELGRSEVEARYYALIEDAFLEPGESGFSENLSTFFDAMDDFANNVEEAPAREALLAQAETLAGSFSEIAGRLNLFRTQANEEVINAVPEVNSLGERIAALNDQIRRAESAGSSANDLRDERGVLLDELAKLVNISYRQRDDGEVDVLIGGDVFVNGVDAREIEAVATTTIDPDRSDFVELRFVDNGRAVNITEGEVFGALNVRDSVVPAVEERIDTLAATLIREVNSIHSQGNGLDNLSGTLTSDNAVSASTDALVSAGLPFTVEPGTFDVVVYDSSGTATTTTVTITNTTTLDDLAASLNTIGNFSATVTSDGHLELGAGAGFTFSFANDSSGVLPALGVNGLFTGHDAGSMAVSQNILDHPELLTSGYSLDTLSTGDNTAALAMADLQNALLTDGDTATLSGYYESTIARVGVNSQANQQRLQVVQSFVDDYVVRREQTSGVSLDEEVSNLILYQRAYEASARVINITDQMLEVLVNLGA